MTATLILLRHGESEWNAKNLFTGWVDVDLNDKGRGEAQRGGELLVESGLLPDVVHTSLLTRAINTAQISLAAADRQWIPVKRSWRLNERHYGALQGKDKAATLAEFGEEQFMIWRRSYDTPPPPIANDDEFANFDDPRYAELPTEARPRTECLKDVLLRALPYWYDDIVPDLRAGKVVLVAAHGNSLRAIVKHLDNIGDAEVVGLNIPTGIPLVYELDDDLKPVTVGGRYLDPEAAAASIEAVKNQGRRSPSSDGRSRADRRPPGVQQRPLVRRRRQPGPAYPVGVLEPAPTPSVSASVSASGRVTSPARRAAALSRALNPNQSGSSSHSGSDRSPIHGCTPCSASHAWSTGTTGPVCPATWRAVSRWSASAYRRSGGVEHARPSAARAASTSQAARSRTSITEVGSSGASGTRTAPSGAAGSAKRSGQ